MRVRMGITRPRWDETSKLHAEHALKFVKETSRIGVCCTCMSRGDFNDCIYGVRLTDCHRLSNENVRLTCRLSQPHRMSGWSDRSGIRSLGEGSSRHGLRGQIASMNTKYQRDSNREIFRSSIHYRYKINVTCTFRCTI